MDNIYTLHSKRVEKNFYGDNSEKKGMLTFISPNFFIRQGKDITMQLNRDSFNVPIIFRASYACFFIAINLVNLFINQIRYTGHRSAIVEVDSGKS